METCSFSDKVNSVFCSFDLLGFYLLPLRIDLFTWLLIIIILQFAISVQFALSTTVYTVACKTLTFSLHSTLF